MSNDPATHKAARRAVTWRRVMLLDAWRVFSPARSGRKKLPLQTASDLLSQNSASNAEDPSVSHVRFWPAYRIMRPPAKAGGGFYLLT
jgi:hypothetical protein